MIFECPKLLIILNIQNNFFWISQIKHLFGIISDIRNNYFGYPKYYFGYPK